MTLNNIPVGIELDEEEGNFLYNTNVDLTFNKEDNTVYLEFSDAYISVQKGTDEYSCDTLCFSIEDLRKIVEEWDKCS